MVLKGTMNVSTVVRKMEGAVASWLVRSSPDRAVGVHVMFLGKTLYSHGASLHPEV